MDDFPTAITEAYKYTLKEDRGLQDPLVNISYKNIAILLENNDFQTLLEEVAGFAADLAQCLTRKNNGPKVVEYRSPACGENRFLGNTNKREMDYCPFCKRSYGDWSQYIVRD